MTIFKVHISTNRENNIWIQRMIFYEGFHAAYECKVNNEDGNFITLRLINELKFIYPALTFLEEQIITALENGRQRFLKENRAVYNVAVEQNLCSDLFLKHMSCWTKIDTSRVVTRQHTYMNGIPSCDIKHHFKRFEGNRAVMNFFNANQCPVCKASYKEILKEDLHIIIQQCGHPVCCKCCDDICRYNEFPTCPVCREDIDMDRQEFHVMKFDVNLKQLPLGRRIYY